MDLKRIAECVAEMGVCWSEEEIEFLHVKAYYYEVRFGVPPTKDIVKKWAAELLYDIVAGN